MNGRAALVGLVFFYGGPCSLTHGFQPRPPTRRIPFEWNGLRSAFFAVAHVLFGKPVSTFPEHALRGPLTIG
jgi:hypothetical protein